MIHNPEEFEKKKSLERQILCVQAVFFCAISANKISSFSPAE